MRSRSTLTDSHRARATTLYNESETESRTLITAGETTRERDDARLAHARAESRAAAAAAAAPATASTAGALDCCTETHSPRSPYSPLVAHTEPPTPTPPTPTPTLTPPTLARPTPTPDIVPSPPCN
ncbi:unnamed protein product, partial [Brenthis ino]